MTRSSSQYASLPTKVFAGYDGGSAYSKPTKEDLSKVVGRSME